MNMKKIKDERVLQLNNKIQSEAYLIILFLLTASLSLLYWFFYIGSIGKGSKGLKENYMKMVNIDYL